MIKFRPVAAALLVPLVLAGCGSATPTQRTVVVTSTAPTPEASQAPVTVPNTSTVSGTAITTGSVPEASGSVASTDTPGASAAASSGSASVAESSFAGPFVTVDPLKQDCAKVLNPATISTSLGSALAGDSNVIVDVANPDRKSTGRIKCLYGVTPERSSGGITVVLTQYQDAAAAAEQVAITVSSEKKDGAKSSTASVKGLPAEVLLRDGGLLVVTYDTWTLTVVAAVGVAEEAALPAALTTMAEYSLTQIVGA